MSESTIRGYGLKNLAKISAYLAKQGILFHAVLDDTPSDPWTIEVRDSSDYRSTTCL